MGGQLSLAPVNGLLKGRRPIFGGHGETRPQVLRFGFRMGADKLGRYVGTFAGGLLMN